MRGALDFKELFAEKWSLNPLAGVAKLLTLQGRKKSAIPDRKCLVHRLTPKKSGENGAEMVPEFRKCLMDKAASKDSMPTRCRSGAKTAQKQCKNGSIEICASLHASSPSSTNLSWASREYIVFSCNRPAHPMRHDREIDVPLLYIGGEKSIWSVWRADFSNFIQISFPG